MAETILYDAYGVPVSTAKRPPESVAQIGRVRDPFSMKELRDVTPELAGRLLRDDAPLHEQQLLVKRIVERDPHIAAVVRDLVLDAASLEWDVLPFRDDGKSGEHTKRAAWVAEQLYAIEEWDDLLEHLVYGECYPFQAAETLWNDEWLPAGFELVDAVRLTRDRDRNQIRLLTKDEPRKGIELPANGFILYHRRVPLWKAVVILNLIKTFSVTDWLAFAEKFGKPIVTGKYSDPNQKDSLLDAVRAISAEFVGVLPEGAAIELKEAQRYGTVQVYEKLQGYADDAGTVLLLGHKLVASSDPGSGTLAGNGARKTNLKILRAVARRLASTIRFYLMRPLVGFHHGWDKTSELPFLKFKWEPPEDQKALSDTYKGWNEVFAAAGEAIDPDHVREVSGIPKTVKRQAPASPTTEDPESKKEARIEAKKPRLSTTDEVESVTARLGQRALESMTDEVLEQLEAAESIEEFADLLWQNYDGVDTEDLAEVLYGSTLAAHELARREADEEAES